MPSLRVTIAVVLCAATALSASPRQSAVPEPPATPAELLAQLGQALSSRNLDAYAALLAQDFVFYPAPGSGIAPLEREQELDLMQRFLAVTAVVQVQVEIPEGAELADGVPAEIRLEVLALDSVGDGYRLYGPQTLVPVLTDSGWRLSAWTDQPLDGFPDPDPTSPWYDLRAWFADRSTAIRGSSWGALKHVHE